MEQSWTGDRSKQPGTHVNWKQTCPLITENQTSVLVGCCKVIQINRMHMQSQKGANLCFLT